MSGLSIEEILEYLPHRYPFILIDRVLSIEPKEKIIAIKNVTMNEAYFAGHFPGKPIMPGVLILEALAQAGAILAFKSMNKKPSEGVMHLFAGVDNARFKQMVTPGDTLRLEVNYLRSKGPIMKVSGTAFVEDRVVCTAELMSATKEMKSD